METSKLANWKHQKMRFLVNVRKPLYLLKYKRIPSDYHISHITLYSAGNAGDTALSTCIRDLFDIKLGNISWNLIPILRHVDRKYIKKLNSDSVVVIGGHDAWGKANRKLNNIIRYRLDPWLFWRLLSNCNFAEVQYEREVC